MVDEPHTRRPPLNTVLRFTKQATPSGITAGGKSRGSIRQDRLTDQQKRLASNLRALSRGQIGQVQFAGSVVAEVTMFEDSLAPSWTPSDLLNVGRGAQFVVPTRKGYLVELELARLEDCARAVERAATVLDQVDISRIEAIRPYQSGEALRGRTAEDIWRIAPERDGGRLFMVRLLPMRTDDAAEAMLARFLQLRGEVFASPGRLVAPPAEEAENPSEQRALAQIYARGDRVSQTVRRYRATRRGAVTVVLKSVEDIQRLVASGSVFRLEPSKPMIGSPSKPLSEPKRPPLPDLHRAPVVGVVDGGLTAASYNEAVAWRADPLVTSGKADTSHGNKVTSLVVHGHAWNPDLELPKVICRVGVVQAIAKRDARGPLPTEDELLAHLEGVMTAHPEVSVWNFSFNQTEPCIPDLVSVLGDELAGLCRKHGNLPLVSVGNGKFSVFAPPADCEAALTIGGHREDALGGIGDPCPNCLPGPGPSGMVKPEASNYSRTRVLGGSHATGSSFSTALSSALAAHTFERLSDPSPDMVRALLVQHAGRQKFCPKTGFGSLGGQALPWECPEGSVTLMWHADLRPGANFYWELPIPQALIENDKLSGFGALTGILDPHPFVDADAGPNYFGVRLNTALQYPSGAAFKNLLGSMETDRIAEMAAREQEHKWSPLRHHQGQFGKRGLAFSGDKLRIYARLYVRDGYAHGVTLQEELPSFRAAFALTLQSNEPSDIYDQTVEELRDFLEPGVIETDIGLEGDV